MRDSRRRRRQVEAVGPCGRQRKEISLTTWVTDLRHVAYSLHQIGTSLYDLGRIHQSEDSHRRAIDIARMIGDSDQVGKSLHEHAMCLFMRGHVRDAMRGFFRARHLSRVTNVRFEPMDWQHIGMCFMECDRLAKALKYFRVAEKLYTKAGDDATLAELYSIIAQCHLLDRAYDAAAQNASIAERKSRESGVAEFIARAGFMVSIAALVREPGDRSHADRVATEVHRARDSELFALYLDELYLCAQTSCRLGDAVATDRANAIARYRDLGNEHRQKSLAAWRP